ncbi:MAG: glycosyltransferase [Desulfurococcales archaeon]|nr:glycosyltransferase [Desulfurococcales archaeon]
MKEVAVITSDRSVSLQRVANDIIKVFRENGVRNVKLILSANADPRLYKDVNYAITVMTFDPAWVKPYLFIARMLRTMGRTSLFYTTTEGRIRRVHGDIWIYRDLSYIANSEYTKEKLIEAGAKVDKVVYHGVNVDSIKSFSWKARSLREKLGLSKDDFVVGYIAGGYMRKGHDIFAEVIRLVQQKDPSIKFVVLTDNRGVNNYKDVENAIILPDFGKLTLDTVYGLYHVFDLYAQASLSEGFGLPCLEALSAGKPVVHADYKPLSEITTKDTSFRVKVYDVVYKRELGSIEYELHYYDPNEFAEMIIYAKDQVLRNRDELRVKCIERARMFDARKTYKVFVDMYYHGGLDYD